MVIESYVFSGFSSGSSSLFFSDWRRKFRLKHPVKLKAEQFRELKMFESCYNQIISKCLNAVVLESRHVPYFSPVCM